MSRYNKNTFPRKNMNLRVCKSRDPYRVRILAQGNLEEAFRSYSQNFYKAAHQVASYLLASDNTDISELDTYFFSLAFLYRHSIELLLKSIAFQVIVADRDRSSFVKTTFHNLEEIFFEVERISFFQRPLEEKQWLKEYFCNISKYDKKSDSFRYPFHVYKSDELFETGEYCIQRIFDKCIHIDLVKFANKFEAAYEILNMWYIKDSDKAKKWKGVSNVFIEKNGAYYSQSVIGYSYTKQDFDPYIHAYMESAGYLRNYMQQLFADKKYAEAETFFIPMCYLYRNCVELSQKAIWFEGTGLDLQTRCKVMLDHKHSIRAMWNMLKKYVITSGNKVEEDVEYIELLRKYCFELHDYDSDASMFRYPVNKDMVPYFHSNRWFDFMNVSKFFEGIINAFYCIEAQITEDERMLESYSDFF